MKHLFRNRLVALILICLCALAAHSQSNPGEPVQMASLRPNQDLLWQRTSPSTEKPDGPVLYQIIFRSSATPGHIPMISPRFTLMDSPFSINGNTVAIGGLSIDSNTGIVSFPANQTFPGAGAVNSVSASNNFISIGGTTANPAIGLNTANTDARYLQLSGGMMTGNVTFTNGQTFPGTGTVNSVTTGDNFISVGGTAVNPTVGLNTTNTDARYLQLGGGTMTGSIIFANGQTFPASGLPNLSGEVSGPLGTTVVSNAVSANTANAIVRRDGTGSFAASNVALSGSLALPNTASASVGVISLGGTPFLHNIGTENTFVGASAGNLTLTGTGNSAFGTSTLQANTTAQYDSAFGDNALAASTTGMANSAFGAFALSSNTTTNYNSAFGTNALTSNTGANNSAFGTAALLANTIGGFNSAFGAFALWSNTSAQVNSAFGYGSLMSNTTGAGNTAFGYNSMSKNTTALSNAAFGTSALASNTASSNNSAFGTFALFSSNTAASSGPNAAFGYKTLFLNTAGTNNTALGSSALQKLATGSNNIAVGDSAGINLTGSETNDIYIGSQGVQGESNTIRIGGTGSTQTATFISGISGATSASGVAVFVDTDGQLGTVTSSRRYKEQIADLGAESDVLMKLRPVSFYYKPQYDSTHTRQYGLVAEEVAKIAPDLVVFDQNGKPQTVRYHFVNAMLLNEMQKQRATIAQQQSEIEEMREQLRELILRLGTVEKTEQSRK